MSEAAQLFTAHPITGQQVEARMCCSCQQVFPTFLMSGGSNYCKKCKRPIAKRAVAKYRGVDALAQARVAQGVYGEPRRRCGSCGESKRIKGGTIATLGQGFVCAECK